VANGVKLHRSDNVILMDYDYPSMILPWMVMAEIKGFQVRLLPRETFLNPEHLQKEINGRTRYVACSHVMFNTGILLPIAELGKVCRKKEVLT
jgi:cysteine desulfurase/selenocysteine lyase